MKSRPVITARSFSTASYRRRMRRTPRGCDSGPSGRRLEADSLRGYGRESARPRHLGGFRHTHKRTSPGYRWQGASRTHHQSRLQGELVAAEVDLRYRGEVPQRQQPTMTRGSSEPVRRGTTGSGRWRAEPHLCSSRSWSRLVAARRGSSFSPARPTVLAHATAPVRTSGSAPGVPGCRPTAGRVASLSATTTADRSRDPWLRLAPGRGGRLPQQHLATDRTPYRRGGGARIRKELHLRPPAPSGQRAQSQRTSDSSRAHDQ